MEIIFRGPHYYSEADEEGFFDLIYSLPEYVEIIGRGRDLFLTLTEPVSYESINQLLTIFHRWEINTDALLSLKNKENEDSQLWKKKL